MKAILIILLLFAQSASAQSASDYEIVNDYLRADIQKLKGVDTPLLIARQLMLFADSSEIKSFRSFLKQEDFKRKDLFNNLFITSIIGQWNDDSIGSNVKLVQAFKRPVDAITTITRTKRGKKVYKTVETKPYAVYHISQPLMLDDRNYCLIKVSCSGNKQIGGVCYHIMQKINGHWAINDTLDCHAY